MLHHFLLVSHEKFNEKMRQREFQRKVRSQGKLARGAMTKKMKLTTEFRTTLDR
jgi:hypothetical protein